MLRDCVRGGCQGPGECLAIGWVGWKRATYPVHSLPVLLLLCSCQVEDIIRDGTVYVVHVGSGTVVDTKTSISGHESSPVKDILEVRPQIHITVVVIIIIIIIGVYVTIEECWERLCTKEVQEEPRVESRAEHCVGSTDVG
jgi:hypothetical protein